MCDKCVAKVCKEIKEFCSRLETLERFQWSPEEIVDTLRDWGKDIDEALTLVSWKETLSDESQWKLRRLTKSFRGMCDGLLVQAIGEAAYRGNGP